MRTIPPSPRPAPPGTPGDISYARVLLMATNGFEEAELFDPRQGLLDAGAIVTLASIDKQPIRGVKFDRQTGQSGLSSRWLTPNLTLGEVDIQQFDVLLLPGGAANPATLRANPDAVDLVRRFAAEGKLVASICHAAVLLAQAGVVEGRRMTGWASIRPTLTQAGANVVDEEVVVDGNLITSRMPSDIPAFTAAVIHALAQAGAQRARPD